MVAACAGIDCGTASDIPLTRLADRLAVLDSFVLFISECDFNRIAVSPAESTKLSKSDNNLLLFRILCGQSRYNKQDRVHLGDQQNNRQVSGKHSNNEQEFVVYLIHARLRSSASRYGGMVGDWTGFCHS